MLCSVGFTEYKQLIDNQLVQMVIKQPSPIASSHTNPTYPSINQSQTATKQSYSLKQKTSIFYYSTCMLTSFFRTFVR